MHLNVLPHWQPGSHMVWTALDVTVHDNICGQFSATVVVVPPMFLALYVAGNEHLLSTLLHRGGKSICTNVAQQSNTCAHLCVWVHLHTNATGQDHGMHVSKYPGAALHTTARSCCWATMGLCIRGKPITVVLGTQSMLEPWSTGLISVNIHTPSTMKHFTNDANCCICVYIRSNN